MFDDFYEKGFQVFDGKKYVNYFEENFFEKLEWTDAISVSDPKGNLIEYGTEVPKMTKELEYFLYTIHQEIGLNIVEKSFNEYSVERRNIWRGVNKYLCDWHTDAYEKQMYNPKEKYYNAIFLLYFNDMKKIKEGSICFKKISTDEEWEIFPEPGTLICFSCAEDFLHRPTFTQHPRIVCSFRFNLIKQK